MAGDLPLANETVEDGTPEVRSGNVYVVYSSRGGAGVTTAAVKLATALAAIERGARVCIADLDPDGCDSCHLLGARRAGSPEDEPARVDDLSKSMRTTSTDRLWILAASDEPTYTKTPDAHVAGALIAQLRRSFTFTIVDCEHQLNDRTLAALDAADRVLLLTELQVPALRAAQKSVSLFRRLGYHNEKLCVLINRHGSSDAVSPADAAQVLKADIFHTLSAHQDTDASSGSPGAGGILASDYYSAPEAWYVQLAEKLTGGTAGRAW
jgi:pilus assembly protein CpaE